jgi:hypothetical protein
MQVFMPYADYKKSVQALDKKRLVKQSLEATQLLDIIFNLPTKSGKPRKGWMNHPALIAWKDTPGALIEYLIHNATEMKARGCKTDYVDRKLQEYKKFTTSLQNPIWLGDEEIHSSHRFRLLQKGFEEKFNVISYKYGDAEKADETIMWYSSFGWEEMKDDEFFMKEYFWPINLTSSSYDKAQKIHKNGVKHKHYLIQTFGANPWA